MPDNFSALIDALEAARKPADDKGLTIREMSLRVGRGEDWVRKRLKEANEAGLLVAGRRTVKALDGRRAHAPVYLFRRGKRG